MRRSTMFISAMLTTFVLVTLASVVYAYRGLALSASPIAPLTVDSQAVSPLPTVLPPAPMPSPQEIAAQVAGQLNRTDLYSIELADFNGIQTYKVTFSAGDAAYVSLTGQMIALVPPPPPVVVSVLAGSGAGAPRGDEEHEEHEREEHDD